MEELLRYIQSQIRIAEDAIRWTEDFPTIKYYTGMFDAYKNLERAANKIIQNGTS